MLRTSPRIKNLLSEKILSGILVSPCLLPCLRTTARVQRGLGTSLADNSSVFALGFSQTVAVKLTRVDTFNFMESLNLLGSNLGLWPGLGLYQLFELLARRFCICNKISSLFRRQKN